MATHVYVGNLGSAITEDTLRTAFSASGGVVKSVVVMRNPRTGRSRGFGFVEMSSDGEAAAAIQSMNGVEVEGQTLKVDEARERIHPRSSRGTPGEGYLGNRSSAKRKGGRSGGGSRQKRR